MRNRNAYSDFITDTGPMTANTVIAGRHRQPKEKQEPSAVKDIPTSATQNAIVVPHTDREQRLSYLSTVRDYLNTQLSIVEAQLDAESSG